MDNGYGLFFCKGDISIFDPYGAARVCRGELRHAYSDWPHSIHFSREDRMMTTSLAYFCSGDPAYSLGILGIGGLDISQGIIRHHGNSLPHSALLQLYVPEDPDDPCRRMELYLSVQSLTEVGSLQRHVYPVERDLLGIVEDILIPAGIQPLPSLTCEFIRQPLKARYYRSAAF